MMHKTIAKLCSIICLCLCSVSTSYALPYITTASFSSSGTLTNSGVAAAPSLFNLDLFDSSLGTLDSVSLQINGATSFTGPTYPNYIPTYPTPIPAVYSITTNIYHHFFGLAGEFFTLDNLAPLSVTLPATGTGAPIGYSHFFNYTFTFTDVTDWAGGGFIGPPATQINGVRDDFIKDTFSLETMQFYSTGGIISPFTQNFSLTTSGSMIIQYEYTPHPTEPAPVPEPATILLLGCGLAGLAWCRRKKEA